MNGWAWFVVIDLAFAGLLIFGRGCAGSTRRYSLIDGLLGLAETAFLIWIVVTKL